MEKEPITNNLGTIDTSSLVDKVEMKLIDLIINKGMQVGDVLPKEVELGEVLGVSRTVIREAMLRLRLIGLIESKKHRGAVLTNPDLLSPLKKSLHPNVLAENTLRDVFEMRLVLELGMADLLFARITQTDIEELEEIVSAEPLKGDSTIFNVTDEIAFHGKLYEISGNQTLKDFQHMLLPVFQYVHSSGMLNDPVQSKSFISHSGLVDILKVGTPEVFRNAMRKHLDSHFSRLF